MIPLCNSMGPRSMHITHCIPISKGTRKPWGLKPFDCKEIHQYDPQNGDILCVFFSHGKFQSRETPLKRPWYVRMATYPNNQQSQGGFKNSAEYRSRITGLPNHFPYDSGWFTHPKKNLWKCAAKIKKKKTRAFWNWKPLGPFCSFRCFGASLGTEPTIRIDIHHQQRSEPWCCIQVLFFREKFCSKSSLNANGPKWFGSGFNG